MAVSGRCAALDAENRELDFRRALDVKGFVADISLVRKQQAATARHAITSARLRRHACGVMTDALCNPTY